MQSTSFEYDSVAEELRLDGKGRGTCTRTYVIRNPSHIPTDLRTATFWARFDGYVENVVLEENGFGGTIELRSERADWGSREVFWNLRRRTLAPGETHEFSLSWQRPHLISVVRDEALRGLRLLEYKFAQEQITDYKLKIILPKKHELLSEPNRRINKIFEWIKRPFWLIQHHTNVPVENEERRGRVVLIHTAENVSNNNPFRLHLLFWLRLPWFLVFVLGVATGLSLELLGSLVWDLIKAAASGDVSPLLRVF